MAFTCPFRQQLQPLVQLPFPELEIPVQPIEQGSGQQQPKKNVDDGLLPFCKLDFRHRKPRSVMGDGIVAFHATNEGKKECKPVKTDATKTRQLFWRA